MRIYSIDRKTAETDINLSLNIDGKGRCNIDTGCGFLDHMLTLFASHGRFDLDVKCKGDTNVDYHHTAEDIGICLGTAFFEALGEKKGIERYGSVTIPMDEALVLCAVDFSSRDFLGYDVQLTSFKVGDFDTELVEEFWLAFVRKAAATLHFKQFAGKNTHHIIECIFKAAARAMKAAVAINPNMIDEIPSTKGVI